MGLFSFKEKIDGLQWWVLNFGSDNSRNYIQDLNAFKHSTDKNMHLLNENIDVDEVFKYHRLIKMELTCLAQHYVHNRNLQHSVNLSFGLYKFIDLNSYSWDNYMNVNQSTAATINLGYDDEGKSVEKLNQIRLSMFSMLGTQNNSEGYQKSVASTVNRFRCENYIEKISVHYYLFLIEELNLDKHFVREVFPPFFNAHYLESKASLKKYKITS